MTPTVASITPSPNARTNHLPVHSTAGSTIVPAQPWPVVGKWFGVYLDRLFRKSFHAVHLAQGSRDVLAAIDLVPGPVVVALNHHCWWDPLVGLKLARTCTPSRSVLAPMERHMLAKFGFFKWLGVFGIDPDAPGALDDLVGYLRLQFTSLPRPTLWITPQGTFADVRAPVRVRPGVAAVAARLNITDVISVATEIVFWTDRRPELCVRCSRVPRPDDEGRSPSTAAWTRALQAAMQANQDELARLVIARDTAAFSSLSPQGPTRVSGIYDWWLRLRRRSGAIEVTDRARR